jgi:hypothetical protein
VNGHGLLVGIAGDAQARVILAQRLAVYKASLRIKIEKANEELAAIKYNFKCN